MREGFPDYKIASTGRIAYTPKTTLGVRLYASGN